METQQHGTQLSPHFTLAEMTRSGSAIRHGIDNTPSPEHVANLRALCSNVLEPMRRRFGMIRVTSGYRCERLNKMVGGAPTSQHLRGEAADINTSGHDNAAKMYEYVRDNLTFDQLLLEHRRSTGSYWLHVSYRSDGTPNRRSCGMIIHR